MSVRAILAALYFQTLDQERARPKWMNGGNVRGSAKYRLAVLVAAPFLFAFYVGVGIFSRGNSPPSQTVLSWMAGGGLLVTNVGAYMYLGKAFDGDEFGDIFPSKFAVPSETRLLLAKVFGYLCIAGYCFALALWN